MVIIIVIPEYLQNIFSISFRYGIFFYLKSRKSIRHFFLVEKQGKWCVMLKVNFHLNWTLIISYTCYYSAHSLTSWSTVYGLDTDNSFTMKFYWISSSISLYNIIYFLLWLLGDRCKKTAFIPLFPEVCMALTGICLLWVEFTIICLFLSFCMCQLHVTHPLLVVSRWWRQVGPFKACNSW